MTVELANEKFITSLFVNIPTDASRYLDRQSDHASHTFRSIPSQLHLAPVLSSDPDDKKRSIDYMAQKLQSSGYTENEISTEREKAMTLNRDAILSRNNQGTTKKTENQLVFTVNRNQYKALQIRRFYVNTKMKSMTF